jgi:hypothetical protein
MSLICMQYFSVVEHWFLALVNKCLLRELVNGNWMFFFCVKLYCVNIGVFISEIRRYIVVRQYDISRTHQMSTISALWEI